MLLYSICQPGTTRRTKTIKEKNVTLESLKNEISQVASDLVPIMQCLEVLENGLYFADERKDKDITKPCAAATEVIIKLVSDCQDRLLDIEEEAEAMQSREV